MSSGVQLLKTGCTTGTGSLINVTVVGYRPRMVELFNTDGLVTAVWTDTMADDSAMLSVTAGTMTFITSDGITPLSNGFSIGTNADLNAAGEAVHWVANQ